MSPSDGAVDEPLRERIMAELLECYGEGENTDWPYLMDLAELIACRVETETTELRGLVDSLTQALRDLFDHHNYDTPAFNAARIQAHTALASVERYRKGGVTR